MRLDALLPALRTHPSFEAVLDQIRAQRRGTLSAITPARPYAVAALHAALERPMLLVVGRPSEARGYANELRAWATDPDAVLLFPETDALPYDRLPNDADKLAERLGTLERVSGLTSDPSPPLIVASVRATMDLLLDPATFRDQHRGLKRGQVQAPAELAGDLLRLGYEPSPLVDQPGLFSRRGGILDVFPPGGLPLRLELDGVRPQFVDPFARDLRLLREGSQAFSTLEFYRGFLGTATLIDYLPADGILAIDEP